MMLSRRMVLLIGATATLSPSVLFAKTIRRFSVGKNDLALKGYDTTAYFRLGRPADGEETSVVEWKGVVWRFERATDAATFRADPEAFAPQFGGYCTRAMSLQKEVPGDPEVWRIHKGKLYVFFASQGGKRFDKDPDAMIAKAQAHWDSLNFVE